MRRAETLTVDGVGGAGEVGAAGGRGGVSEGQRRVAIDAPAKLNLGLEVVRRRDDGYHELATIFLAIDLVDRLELSEVEQGRDGGVSLLSPGPSEPGEGEAGASTVSSPAPFSRRNGRRVGDEGGRRRQRCPSWPIPLLVRSGREVGACCSIGSLGATLLLW